MATTRPRQIYTLEDLATRMERSSRGRYSHSDLLAFFEYFADELERILHEGSSLHTPYFKISTSIGGKFSGMDDRFHKSRHKIELKLNPGKRLKGLVRGMKTQKVSPSNPHPAIQRVYDLVQECQNTGLSIGKPAKIEGVHLKLDEADTRQGIFLLGEKGKATRITQVFQNTPTRLMFQVPDELKPGTYKLEVRAKVGNSTALRKGQFNSPILLSILR